MMRMVRAAASLVLCVAPAFAEQVLREVTWDEAMKKGSPAGAEVLSADAETPYARLRVANPGGGAMAVQVLALEAPGIGMATYALRGRVRCEGVEGEGYLEMWSFFPGGGRCFSRTLGASGPMASLGGSTPWRHFVLPFFNKQDAPRPEKLVVNVVLPGRGAVDLGPLTLAQYGPGEDPMAVPGHWWGEQQGGLVGGIFGAVIGCLGGLVGILAGSGRARGFAVGTMRVMALAGVVSLVVGAVALASSQPYAVYFPLLLAGGLCTALPAGLLPTVRRRYEEVELRRMEALDT